MNYVSAATFQTRFGITSCARVSRTLLVVAVALGMALPLTAQARWRQAQAHYAAGHILVTPRATVNDAEFVNLAARHGGRAHSRFRATRLHVIDVAPGQEEATVQALALDPEVESAEVDRLVDPEVVTYNDKYFSNAWQLAKIGAPTAWDTATGAGVTVAILDSGVDSTHPDLAGKLVPGWNLVDNNSNTSDVYGHGTEVAGVVGAVANNTIGVTSIAPGAKLMPVRVALTSGSAYISTIASGIIYAADHGAKIANASFATLTGSPTIQSAANYMRSKGGLVVVAAGNYGVLDSTPNTGAVISVSATDSSDALTSWSSFGPYVDVAAPGAGIWSTTRGGGYAAVSGTSFSSPVTCAVLALMKSANPSLSNVVLESLLKSTAVDRGTPGYDQYYGYGRVNAAAAVAAAAHYGSTASVTVAAPVVTDTSIPSVTILSPTGGTVRGATTVSIGASDNVGVTQVDLYVGTTLIGSRNTTPYTFPWDTRSTANGAQTLTAYARDKTGNRGVSTKSVNVANDRLPPTVTVLTPTANSIVSGSVTVNVSASDDVGVTWLALIIDGVRRASTTNASVSYVWSSRSAGTHSIMVRAQDAAGHLTVKSITVTSR